MRSSVLIIILFVMVSSVSAQGAISVECGTILDDEFTEIKEQNLYTIDLEAGTQLNVTGVPLGDTLTFVSAVYAPDDSNIAYSNSFNSIAWTEREEDKEITSPTGIVSANGTYTIVVANGDLYLPDMTFYGNRKGGVGTYTIYIGCTLRNGTVIEPGDTASPEESQPINTDQSFITSSPSFSGYGFPGLPSRDFSKGIEIPLVLNQPQTAPIGGDVIAVYTYEASSGETETLSISRISGDISIGVAVINKADNEIIFIGGLSASNNLSVDLAFPVNGTYGIGLFRLDTTNHLDTSGAVQIKLT